MLSKATIYSFKKDLRTLKTIEGWKISNEITPFHGTMHQKSKINCEYQMDNYGKTC